MSLSAVADQIQEVFTVTIAASGREHRAVHDADVFSWNELPELLAAEDLFEAGDVAEVGQDSSALAAPARSSAVLGDSQQPLSHTVVRASDDDDDFDDDDDEDEDEDDDLDEDEDEDDDGEDDEEWEEVEDDEDEDEDEENEDEDDEEEDDEDWEDDDEDWEDDDEEDEDDDEDD
jgi:hypothetical protein